MQIAVSDSFRELIFFTENLAKTILDILIIASYANTS